MSKLDTLDKCVGTKHTKHTPNTPMIIIKGFAIGAASVPVVVAALLCYEHYVPVPMLDIRTNKRGEHTVYLYSKSKTPIWIEQIVNYIPLQQHSSELLPYSKNYQHGIVLPRFVGPIENKVQVMRLLMPQSLQDQIKADPTVFSDDSAASLSQRRFLDVCSIDEPVPYSIITYTNSLGFRQTRTIFWRSACSLYIDTDIAE